MASAEGTGDAVKLSGKSHLRSLDDPSLVQLRLRALFGVGARAEIVSHIVARRTSGVQFGGYHRACHLLRPLPALHAARLQPPVPMNGDLVERTIAWSRTLFEGLAGGNADVLSADTRAG